MRRSYQKKLIYTLLILMAFPVFTSLAEESATLKNAHTERANRSDSLQPNLDQRANNLSRHALIIGISHYFDPRISVLKGIKHDIESATKMAEAMGVPRQNIRYIRDLDATASNIEKAILELNSRVQPGDRVFFYFSGHGTRWFDPSIKKDECVEGLMPADSKPLTNERITALFKPVADKSDKLFMFYDACHSGGVVDKAVASRGQSAEKNRITPKFTSPGGSEQCFKPVNIKDRSLGGSIGVAGLSLQNVVQVSSARPEEVSFDDEHIGGLATETWRKCMLGDAKDLDHSGGVTVEEIAACAQVKLTNYFTTNHQYEASHITIGGNKSFIPAWFLEESSSNSRPASSSNISTLQVPLPQSSPLAIPTPLEQQPAVPITSAPQTYSTATFNDIYAQRDANRAVKVQINNRSPKIGIDAIEFSVNSDKDGYVYVIMLGSDKKTFTILFPNELDNNNFIKAGRTLKIPRDNWTVTAQGPAGKDQLLVTITDNPRDLAMLNGKKAGPFMQSLTDNNGRANLQWVIGAASARNLTDCNKKPASLALSDASKCSDSFGAELVEISER